MITLDTINSFAVTGNLLVNDQRTGFESVGILHRLKSFFGFGDAREQNKATLNAIKTAIFTDSRFSQKTDLKAHAERLLEGVRTDRAIDASRIRDIVQNLEALASGSKSMMEERVDIHLAGGNFPDNVRQAIDQYGDQVAVIAKRVVSTSRPVTVRPNSAPPNRLVNEMDVDRVIQVTASYCPCVVDSFGALPDSNTKAIKDFVGKHLPQFMLNPDGLLRSRDEIGYGVEFCRLASRGARRWIREDSVDLPGIPSREIADFERATPYEMAAVQFLAEVGRPVKPAIYAKIEQAVSDTAGNMSFRDFSAMLVDDSTSADSVQAAFAGMVRRVASHPIRNDDGTPFFENGDKTFDAVVHYEAELMALRLPESARTALCEKLNAKSAVEAFELGLRIAMAHPAT